MTPIRIKKSILPKYFRNPKDVKIESESERRDIDDSKDTTNILKDLNQDESFWGDDDEEKEDGGDKA